MAVSSLLPRKAAGSKSRRTFLLISRQKSMREKEKAMSAGRRFSI